MREDKSCYNCKINCDHYSPDGLIYCSNWEPKEKPMENKVKMTEDQFITMMNDIGWTEIKATHYILNEAKKSGYIHKDIVEEAEEIFKRWDAISGISKEDYQTIKKGFFKLKAEKVELIEENLKLKYNIPLPGFEGGIVEMYNDIEKLKREKAELIRNL